jgi:hypothetical protein
MRPLLPVLSATIALAATAWAQETPAPPTEESQPPHSDPPLVAPIPGLFDISLPRLYAPGTFHVLLNPSSGDFFHRDYVRVPTGLRWTVNDSLEFHAEAEAYLSNWFRKSDAGYGIGELDTGMKYVFPDLFRPDFKTSFNLDVLVPVGSPPVDLTDGLNHISPSLVIEHHSVTRPRLSTFAGYGVDLVSHSFVHGTYGTNEPHDNSMSINGGAIYDMGQLKWTFQATYTTTALIGGHPIHIVSLQPSFIWFVPKRFTLNSKTQWIIGLGVHSTWGPDGFQFSTGSRLRADITFGQVMSRLRGTFDFAQ